ncbi:hypothetical protein BN2476_110274 [Paraburkholderia piptadeniae]|uniref:Uncharacterized protein n=1 Tax=Paraburkholderia piptadeniae TaxID=1701573 RepID=A0A1N7RQQ8_9BURK|nr:hypothetical protein BN2476_110274 [Paraburkholderia piptadeniae]
MLLFTDFAPETGERSFYHGGSSDGNTLFGFLVENRVGFDGWTTIRPASRRFRRLQSSSSS